MEYRYEFTSLALKQISKLPKDVQKRILKKLDYYCQQNNILKYADFLTDTKLGDFRFRIGDYRVVFDVEGEVLLILSVGHRREIYKKR